MFHIGCSDRENENIAFQPAETPERVPLPRTCTLDFRNFAYPPIWHGKQITLKDGESVRTEKEAGFKFLSEYYGDVTGDGKVEAVITLGIISGGSAAPMVVYIFRMDPPKPPLLLWKFESGDRGDGGLRNVYAVDGQLVVETYEPGKHLGDCCSTSFVRSLYAWKWPRFTRTEEVRGIPNDGVAANFIGTTNACPEASPQ